ncbi:hypothetical protein SDC9_199945 [bioreactor metagenome]|uniref:Uncharacterized protein n=1 Tax=bioreactor metagenome TaxID=1076179 RepID=A0A645IPG0_9ZZZZ
MEIFSIMQYNRLNIKLKFESLWSCLNENLYKNDSNCANNGSDYSVTLVVQRHQLESYKHQKKPDKCVG